MVYFVLHFFHFLLIIVLVVEMPFCLVNRFIRELRDVALNFMRVQNVDNVELLEMVQDVLAGHFLMIDAA